MSENDNHANENHPPLDVVEHFRFLNYEMEIELFARIRLLENRFIEGLPPQLHFGEYEALVRGFLENTLTVPNYCSQILNELFDITVMELKGDLVEKVSSVLLREPPARLREIS